MNNYSTLSEQTMFGGKYLPGFFEQYAPLYRRLVEEHGADKVYKVYDYFFGYLSKMHWGQYFVLDRLCPEQRFRMLVFWCLECIYQSDLLSQFAFRHVKIDEAHDEVRVYVVEPTMEQKQKWQFFLPQDMRYSLIDWFGRLRDDPKAMTEVNPAWLMLDAGGGEDAVEEETSPDNLAD